MSCSGWGWPPRHPIHAVYRFKPPNLQTSKPPNKEPQASLQGAQTSFFSSQGVAALWGGDYTALPLPPRLLSLDQFANEAEDRGVTVFMAMRGGSASDGTIQAWLDSYGVPYTGA